MMSKKDYETIAGILKAEGIHFVSCGMFADAFGKDNPAFNRRTFMKACGWDDGKAD